MAQSIYETLETLTTETSVPVIGKMVKHTLPKALFPTVEQFSDSQKLIEWAEENEITYPVLQRGITAMVIDCRQVFKTLKKGASWDHDAQQKKLDSLQWKPFKRPETKESEASVAARTAWAVNVQMAMSMLQEGVPSKWVEKTLKAACGDAAEEVLKAAKAELATTTDDIDDTTAE